MSRTRATSHRCSPHNAAHPRAAARLPLPPRPSTSACAHLRRRVWCSSPRRMNTVPLFSHFRPVPCTSASSPRPPPRPCPHPQERAANTPLTTLYAVPPLPSAQHIGAASRAQKHTAATLITPPTHRAPPPCTHPPPTSTRGPRRRDGCTPDTVSLHTVIFRVRLEVFFFCPFHFSRAFAGGRLCPCKVSGAPSSPNPPTLI